MILLQAKKKVFIAIMPFFFMINATIQQVNFSGTWTRNTEKSDAGDISMNTLPVEIVINQNSTQIEIKRTTRSGNGDIAVNTETVKLDGSVSSSTTQSGRTKQSVITLSDDKKIIKEAANYLNKDGSSSEKRNETWELLDDGKTLRITGLIEDGERKLNWTGVFDLKK